MVGESDGDSPAFREFFNAGIFYASRSPEFPDGPNPLVIHDRNDVQVGQVDPTTFPGGGTSFSSATMAQWNGSSIAVAGVGGVYAVWRLDVAQDGSGANWSGLIPAGVVMVGREAIRQDGMGRLVLASRTGAQRFTPTLESETVVALTGAPDIVTVDPDGDLIYGVKVSGGTLTILSWSIDGGGGAATTLATHTATNFGQPGIAVAPDGTVVVAVSTLDGTGSLPNLYVKKVLLYVVGGATYDLTAALPDSTGGNPNSGFDSAIYNNIGMGATGRNQMTAETYGSERNAWFVLAHNRTGGTDGYIIGVSIDDGSVFHSSIHVAGSDTAIGNSDIFISVPITGGCTVGGHTGDIYSYSTVSSGGQFKGAIYRSDQSPALQEVIPVDGLAVDRPVVESMKLYGGDLYLVYSETPNAAGFSLPLHPHPCIKKVSGLAGHAVTVLYDWDGNADGDVGPFDITFDSSGNIYVGVLGALQNGADEFQPGGMKLWLYKLQPDGTRLWRKEMPTGTGGWDCGFVWLANDDKTLLYSSYDSNGDPTDQLTYFSFFDMVKRYDLLADIPKADLFTITSAADTVGPPTAPYLTIRDSGRALLLPDSKLIVTVTSETTGHTILDSTQGYRGPGSPFLYQSGSLLGSFYRDSGGSLDTDPDGVSVWFMTGPHQPDASYHYLSRYNIASGTRTKDITLVDENGTAIIHHPMAICGGQGGHGNPPPITTSSSRVWGIIIG